MTVIDPPRGRLQKAGETGAARRCALPDGVPMRWLIPLLIVLPAAAQAADKFADAKALISGPCAVCHKVPGVPGAMGEVGPPLAGFARRPVIAGKLANNPANLMQWLMHPQQAVPGTAMPDLGLSEDQARKIADYLQTLDKE
jgi:cytochrome c1